MNKADAERIAAKIQAANTASIIGGKITSASLEITVHRINKDERYGIVSYYHKNPFIHYPVNFMIWLRGIKRKWQQSLQTKEKK